MPVVPFEVRTGYRVEARDGELGVVREIFNGPPRSMFVDAEPYVRVSSSGQPDLNVPLSEVVDVSEGRAEFDERHRRKQPDWSYDADDSGAAPADRLADHRLGRWTGVVRHG